MAVPPPDYKPAPFVAWLRKHIWFSAAVLGMLTITVMRPRTRHVPDAPEVITTLPAFEWIDAQGRPFTKKDLEGRVWVASFLFTTCPSSCPAVAQAARSLQERYAQHGHDEIGLLTFTVDPETDTPDVLRSYAADLDADPARWRFLTAEDGDALRAFIESGFKLAVGAKEEVAEAPGVFDIAHSTKLALIDGEGNVRGYYSTDAMGLDEVFHRSQHVLREQRKAASK